MDLKTPAVAKSSTESSLADVYISACMWIDFVNMVMLLLLRCIRSDPRMLNKGHWKLIVSHFTPPSHNLLKFSCVLTPAETYFYLVYENVNSL